METLLCNESGCNLHDYEIRAYGVCRHLDHLRNMEAVEPPDIGEAVRSVLKELLPPLLDSVLENTQARDFDDDPPRRTYPKTPERQTDGGVPL